jgi:hypothetical protein
VKHGPPAHGRRRRLILVATLALLIVGGLFCAPSVAGQQEFGHQHGDHDSEHVHDIDLILRNPILTERETFTLLGLTFCYSLPGPWGDQPKTRIAESANPIRGPPAL